MGILRTFSSIKRRLIPVHRATIDLRHCVHYCAFSYGTGIGPNPYEDYIRNLHAGMPTESNRSHFDTFLQHYRPRGIGAATGATLATEHRLWEFPWAGHVAGHSDAKPGWFDDPEEIPDVISHFSPAGILRRHLVEEYAWLERAYANMRDHGYDILTHRPIIVAPMRNIRGQCRWLVLDGNHRIAALATLGIHQAVADISNRHSIDARDVDLWTGVRSGSWSRRDAFSLLETYFSPTNSRLLEAQPCPIIG